MRMKRLITLLLAVLAFSPLANAGFSGLSEVLSARKLLAPGTWSRVLQLDWNRSDAAYSKSVYSLVFEMASVLWLYSPEQGTQSLSQYVGKAEQDKKQLEPLLRELFPKLRYWREIEPTGTGHKTHAVPRNACFIQSLALLEERKRDGLPLESACLFSYYYAGHRGTSGHTVLLYTIEGQSYILDPADRKPQPQRLCGQQADRRLAERLAGGAQVKAVRVLPLALIPRPMLETTTESFQRVADQGGTPQLIGTLEKS